MTNSKRDFTIDGLNHLGLIVPDIQCAKKWFIETLGLELLEDRGEMFFFLAGKDVIATKTRGMAVAKPEHGLEEAGEDRSGWQTLDHYGFYAKERREVDLFAAYVQEEGAKIIKGPYDRRDGRSVYFKDPLGLVGEYLYFDVSSYFPDA